MSGARTRTCRGCGKKLRPHTTLHERRATPDELARAQTEHERHEAERRAIQQRMDDGDATTAETVRALNRAIRQHKYRERQPGGVVVHVHSGTAWVTTVDGYGHEANGEFCSMRCAFRWAVAVASRLTDGAHTALARATGTR